eukprot:2201004-Amphidinium_carterae.2
MCFSKEAADKKRKSILDTSDFDAEEEALAPVSAPEAVAPSSIAQASKLTEEVEALVSKVPASVEETLATASMAPASTEDTLAPASKASAPPAEETPTSAEEAPASSSAPKRKAEGDHDEVPEAKKATHDAVVESLVPADATAPPVAGASQDADPAVEG